MSFVPLEVPGATVSELDKYNRAHVSAVKQRDHYDAAVRDLQAKVASDAQAPQQPSGPVYRVDNPSWDLTQSRRLLESALERCDAFVNDAFVCDEQTVRSVLSVAVSEAAASRAPRAVYRALLPPGPWRSAVSFARLDGNKRHVVDLDSCKVHVFFGLDTLSQEVILKDTYDRIRARVYIPMLLSGVSVDEVLTYQSLREQFIMPLACQLLQDQRQLEVPSPHPVVIPLVPRLEGGPNCRKGPVLKR